MAATLLTPELARRWIAYNPTSGNLTWLRSPRYRIPEGSRVCGLNLRGYVQVCLLGGKYTGHRLAWFLHFGEWPKLGLDHINGLRSDNRLANLRDVGQAVNNQNRRSAQRSNSTGFLGVSRFKNRFKAVITVDGKILNLGNYRTPQEAHTAYVTAKRDLHVGCSI